MKSFGAKFAFWSWSKKNWKELLFIVFFAILNIFFLNYASAAYSISLGSKRYLIILIAVLILEILVSLLVFKSKTKKWPIEKLFLILFIPIGIIYMLAIPIGRVPDENAHLARAYGISVGHFITSTNENGEYGEYLPSELATLGKNNTYKNSLDVLNTNNDNNYIFVNNSNIAIYNFVNFIPQSLGMFLGQVLHLPAIVVAYLGRLFNFMCFTILFYFSIKKIPFGKTFLFFVAFLPIVLQEAISLSADCLAIGVSAALISFILYLSYDKSSKITKKNYSILLLLILFESLCKIVYLPLCFLIFLIPKTKFKSKKDYLLKTILPVVITTILSFVWLKIASNYLIEYNPGVNSGEQIKYILTNPIIYAQTIFNTCISSMYQFLYGMFGGWLEWLDVEVGHIYLVLSIIVSTVLIYKNSYNNLGIPNTKRALVIVIAIATIGLIFTSLYVQWTPLGSSFIGGLQGRYFLPVFFLTPVIACGVRKKHNIHDRMSEDHRLLYLFSAFHSFAAVVIIICSHLG